MTIRALETHYVMEIERLTQENAALRDKVARYEEVLLNIYGWQFPDSGQPLADGTPMSYATALREHIREIARRALATKDGA